MAERIFRVGTMSRAWKPAPLQRGPQLFVSFWNVCLENLPLGVFNHRRLSAREAKQLIVAARKRGSLMGVSEDDLQAPDREREKDNHLKLCRALRKHHDIALSIKDFVSDRRGSNVGDAHAVNPLQLVEVRAENQLLVVDCHFALRAPARRGHLEFAVAADSASFHLFEAGAVAGR